MKPSIGRIVHYVSYGTPGGEYGKECRAAIVTEVDPLSQPDGSQAIGLCVINPTGLFLNRHVLQADLIENTAMYPGGTWHWPERIE